MGFVLTVIWPVDVPDAMAMFVPATNADKPAAVFEIEPVILENTPAGADTVLPNSAAPGNCGIDPVEYLTNLVVVVAISLNRYHFTKGI